MKCAAGSRVDSALNSCGITAGANVAAWGRGRGRAGGSPRGGRGQAGTRGGQEGAPGEDRLGCSILSPHRHTPMSIHTQKRKVVILFKIPLKTKPVLGVRGGRMESGLGWGWVEACFLPTAKYSFTVSSNPFDIH